VGSLDRSCRRDRRTTGQTPKIRAGLGGGGRIVSTRWRTSALVGLLALLVAACTGGGATTAPST